MAESGASEKETDALRIYIGGLGATVTAEDLTKTFSAPNLGTVIDVEIIRTKHRSFAYFDFLPCSQKGLAKLFSTYNGCKWKGGSLKLEKAKEYYLQRMRREWEEDTELASNFLKEDGDASENVLHTVQSKKLPDLDKMQLKIFFPRLGKVKAVPFKGTGKHKYSFQRIGALPLPKYFCDCEEHSGTPDVDKEHQRHDDTEVKYDSFDENEKEIDNGEIDEQELTMMNSVMSKLFEREVFSEASRKCGSSAITFKNVNSISDLLSAEEHPDQMSDEDNLIINIVGGSKTNATSNQDLCLKELRSSKSRPQNLHTSNQKMTVPVGEKRKQLKDDKTRIVSDVARRKIRKILPSDKDEKANLSHSKSIQTSEINVSKKCSDGHENSDEPQTNVSETIHNKPSQLQKPARRLLSTEVDNSTNEISSSAPSESPEIDFQIGSDILSKPHTAEKDKNNSSFQINEARVSAEVLTDSGKMIVDNKASRGSSWLQKSSWTQLVAGSESSSFSISHILPQINFDKQEIQQTVIDFSTPKQTVDVPVPQELDGQTNEAYTSSASNNHPLAAKKVVTDADEPFIRTATSMKEYAKLRASFKKKGDKK